MPLWACNTGLLHFTFVLSCCSLTTRWCSSFTNETLLTLKFINIDSIQLYLNSLTMVCWFSSVQADYCTNGSFACLVCTEGDQKVPRNADLYLNGCDMVAFV